MAKQKMKKMKLKFDLAATGRGICRECDRPIGLAKGKFFISKKQYHLGCYFPDGKLFPLIIDSIGGSFENIDGYDLLAANEKQQLTRISATYQEELTRKIAQKSLMTLTHHNPLDVGVPSFP